MPSFHIIFDGTRGQTVEMRLPDATAMAVKSAMKGRDAVEAVEVYRARKGEQADTDFDGSDLQDRLISRIPELAITFKVRHEMTAASVRAYVDGAVTDIDVSKDCIGDDHSSARPLLSIRLPVRR